MAKLPWKPLRIQFNLDRQIDEAFDQLIRSPWGLADPLPAWRPEIDVYETDDAYVLEADVPGVTCEGLCIEVATHWVTLSGSRRSTEMERSAQGLKLERRQGSFSRRIYLNAPVDCDQFEHVCTNGLHRIRLNKRPPP